MKLNVAYSCNSAYICHTGISLISLFENNKDFAEIEIFFISKDTTKDDISSLKRICDRYGRILTVICFEKLCTGLEVSTISRHIHTIYAKLFFSRIYGIDKILYIDSDTIINGPLDELWQIDLNDNTFAGVNARAINDARELNLSKDAPFINDGITLINLTACRVKNITEKFIKFIQQHNGKPPYLSEGTINKVCMGNILVIHPKFNLMSGLIGYKENKYSDVKNFYSDEIIIQATKEPIIIHYLSGFFNRPWSIYCKHPMKDRYLYFKSMSEWAELPLIREKLPLRLKLIGILFEFLPRNIYYLLQYQKRRLFR